MWWREAVGSAASLGGGDKRGYQMDRPTQEAHRSRSMGFVNSAHPTGYGAALARQETAVETPAAGGKPVHGSFNARRSVASGMNR